MKTSQSDLTQGDIKTHIKNIALPSSIGYFFHTMFNVTDTFFAGEISTQALAALSLTFSIFFMIIALAGGMSQSVTALLGNALGEKNESYAKQIVYHSGILGLILSIFLTIIGLVLAPIFIKLLGAQDAYLQEALSYINIILYGAVFFIIVFFANAILNALGNAKVYRNFLVGGAFANILLDFWFVKGGFGVPALGVGGIALATVFIEIIGALYLFLAAKKTTLFQDMPPFVFDIQIMKDFIKQGMPPTANMLLMALGMYIITYFIAPFGQYAVAAYGVAVRIEQIILLPSIGINVAVLAIVSQNNGAKEFERIKETIRETKKLGFILWIIGIFFLFVFGAYFMSLFTKDTQVIAAGNAYLQAAAVSLYAYVLVFIHISLLQGIKQPALLVYLGLLRQVIVPVTFFGIFALLDLDLQVYWWGIAATIWGSAFFILWYAKRKLNKLN
ncbi:MAG: MATE family efflux transporter [Sulfurospirillum sp.]|nr:MATE family efflux transporter [Sulfurospirillum sp.]